MDPGRIRDNAHKLVQIFKDLGWGWGGDYGDTMHFSFLGGS